ncbi:hypothetical protein BJ165DRAFT_1321023, partial [Panaeolus papilionaceus]
MAARNRSFSKSTIISAWHSSGIEWMDEEDGTRRLTGLDAFKKEHFGPSQNTSMQLDDAIPEDFIRELPSDADPWPGYEMQVDESGE